MPFNKEEIINEIADQIHTGCDCTECHTVEYGTEIQSDGTEVNVKSVTFKPCILK